MKCSKESFKAGLSKSHKSAKLSYREKDAVKVLLPVNYSFGIGLNFQRTLLANRSTLYDERVENHVDKLVSRLQVQIKSQLFDPMNPLLIIWILHPVKMTFDSKVAHEGAAKWGLPSFMKKTTATAPTAVPSLEARSSLCSIKGAVLTLPVQVIN